ncbi:MAG: 2-oxoacid:acceptor oxidoreductase subunit alpha [Myxococcaceae bacterium]
MATDIVIGMAGSGGDGIVSAGDSLVSAAAREGFHAVMTKSFGPQIRGGESSCRVRLSAERLHNPGGILDIAVALNWDDFLKFGGELKVDAHTVVVYDTKTGVAPDKLPLVGVEPAEVHAVPFTDLTKSAAGTEKAKTSVVLGLISGWMNVARDSLLKGLKKKFGKKSEELLVANEKAFEAGFQYAKDHPLKKKLELTAPTGENKKKLLTDGNDLTAAAALFAGCEFFGGYPITPSSEIMQYLGREIWKYGGAMLQAEDEIAGIATAVGASFAGKKSMTATSGPGMDLKTEVLGLASIAELPLVLVNVQRGGPSTGIPTKPEQSDLFQACFSGHGDVMRPVLAPTSVADCFETTVEAFNLAEKYQTPVIILSDQEIAQRKETVDLIDTTRFKIETRKQPTPEQLEKYVRFAATDDGISPLSHPGMPKGAYLASGIEHNESGAPSANGAVHTRMNEKRFKKFASLQQRRDLVRTFGDPKAQVGLVAWGSLAGVCREAVDLAAGRGLKVKLLVPVLLYPFVEGAWTQFFEGLERGLVVEQSHQGQLYRLMRMFLDVPKGLGSFCKSGANPIQPTEIVNKLEALRSAKG